MRRPFKSLAVSFAMSSPIFLGERPVGYISTIYWCDKAKGTKHVFKIKQKHKIDIIGKSNKQILNINNKKFTNNWRLTDQMLERINTAWKYKQLRSSLVFYTISLKQISPLTLSLWCFKTRGRLPPKIKWSNSMKKKHSRLCSTNYSMPLSLSLTQNEWIKISHLESFLWKVLISWMRDNETIRYLKLKHRFRDYCCAQTLTQ